MKKDDQGWLAEILSKPFSTQDSLCLLNRRPFREVKVPTAVPTRQHPASEVIPQTRRDQNDAEIQKTVSTRQRSAGGVIPPIQPNTVPEIFRMTTELQLDRPLIRAVDKLGPFTPEQDIYVKVTESLKAVKVQVNAVAEVLYGERRELGATAKKAEPRRKFFSKLGETNAEGLEGYGYANDGGVDGDEDWSESESEVEPEETNGNSVG
jgi:hypothetical protein